MGKGGGKLHSSARRNGSSFTLTVVLPAEVKAVLDSSFTYHIAAQQGKIQRKEPGRSCTLNQADIMNSIF